MALSHGHTLPLPYMPGGTGCAPAAALAPQTGIDVCGPPVLGLLKPRSPAGFVGRRSKARAGRCEAQRGSPDGGWEETAEAYSLSASEDNALAHGSGAEREFSEGSSSSSSGSEDSDYEGEEEEEEEVGCL